MIQRSRHLPVAFPGAPGVYSQRATQRYFGDASAQLTCKNAEEAVRAVSDGRASHAVLPVENSITGALAGVAEALFVGDVGISGELVMPIRHCLMGAPGTRLEDLSVVTSHPSSLAQCRDWLATWHLATQPTEDTAVAAGLLKQSGDKALAVLGSRELADDHGLVVLAEGVSDKPDNRTRFLVLSQAKEIVARKGTRHALRIGPVSAPRALKTLRIQLESFGARRVRVPFLGAADGHQFLGEFDFEGDGPGIARLACGTLEQRYLGSWTPGAR